MAENDPERIGFSEEAMRGLRDMDLRLPPLEIYGQVQAAAADTRPHYWGHRERLRQRRLGHLALVLLPVLAWASWRAVTDQPLLPDMPVVDPLYLIVGVFFLVMLLALVGTQVAARRSPHVTYRPEDIDVTRAEVQYALTAEGALNVDDILARRTRIALVPSDADAARPAVTEIVKAAVSASA